MIDDMTELDCLISKDKNTASEQLDAKHTKPESRQTGLFLGSPDLCNESSRDETWEDFDE